MSKRNKVNKNIIQKPKKSEFPDNREILDFKKPLGKSTLIFLIGLLLLLFVFIDFGVKVTNPWSKALNLLDSSTKEIDPKIRAELLDESGSIIRSVLQRTPKHAKVNFLNGYFFFVRGEFDSSIFYYEKAIELDRMGVVNKIDIQAQKNIGDVVLTKSDYLIRRGLIDSAITFTKIYQVKYPGQLTMIMVLSRLYNLKNSPDSSLVYSLHGLELFPKNPDLNALAGNAYEIKLDTLKALEFYEKTLDINPGFSPVRIAYNKLKKNQIIN